ncbi:hypothetical protein [Paenibacillus sp. 1P07SE]|uniref:hypothetical protein n=1 Tax=Paenibacillus sp. 1P07SE TaxID=3132209 RepID=UPI0039A4A997
MDQERRNVIVREIEHWQRSKLLPDQYCDFLLNLYLDEATERTPSGLAGKTAALVRRSRGSQWFYGVGLISLICMIVLYFNDFPLILQIVVLVAATAVLIAVGQRKRHAQKESVGMAWIASGMLAMLGGGLYLLERHAEGSWGWLGAFLGLCAVFWIAYGLLASIPLLHLCGWAAAMMVYALLLHRLTDQPAWYDIQLYWVPVAFLFAWGSWLVQRLSKRASSIFFVGALLLWFMPEIYHAVLIDEPAWLQLQLLAKLAIAGILLFTLRKKWIAWVA